ncbi:MAG: CarD family transcriptional regulator [Bdellovibrionota bacterium]
MRFKVGDKAVYPSHGVTVIKNIESKEVAGSKMDFYVLQIVSSGATLMVPTAASERAGMRGLISSSEIESVYSILRNPGKVSQRTWNRRFREFNEKLRTGSLSDIAEVLRDLWTLQSAKDLSYGEKKMMERAQELIVSEICAAQGSKPVDVESEITQMLMPN